MGENDGDRTHDTQGHNLVLYQLSYILRGTPCLHGSRRVRNRYHAVLAGDLRPGGPAQASGRTQVRPAGAARP